MRRYCFTSGIKFPIQKLRYKYPYEISLKVFYSLFGYHYPASGVSVSPGTENAFPV